MKHRIAFYDLDKTITRSPTWTRFLLHSAWHGPRWRLALLPFAGLASGGYALRLIDRGGLKRITHRMLLGRSIADGRMTQTAARFAERTVSRNLLAHALARIEADRAAGYRLVLATASYDFYVRAIGAALGFDDVVATAGVRAGPDWHVPGIDGENCYGPAKLRKVEAWMRREGVPRDDAHVRFYTDHVSDAQMLGWADEPFAVNAHRPLRMLAAKQGWTILDWRSR